MRNIITYCVLRIDSLLEVFTQYAIRSKSGYIRLFYKSLIIGQVVALFVLLRSLLEYGNMTIRVEQQMLMW